MPAGYVRGIVRQFREREQCFRDPFPFRVNSRSASALVHQVMDTFAVSEEAARVRLVRRGVLRDAVQGRLFA